VFRNETQATERRARRSINSKKVKLQNEQWSKDRVGSQSSATSSGSSEQRALIFASSGSPRHVPPTIDIPVGRQAIHYFLANCIMVPTSTATRGHMSYLTPLLKGEPPDTPLSTSFVAVAFASFGNRPGNKQLLFTAHHFYTKALKHVNRALESPIEQKSDKTLASVLLLGLFEVSSETNVYLIRNFINTDGYPSRLQ
jgi:hypothetical protein